MPPSMEMEVADGKRKYAAAASAMDWLSNLPDCLLLVILSLLPSRQAVQTCVLSRRWPHLWRAVTSIRIDSADFWTHDQEGRHEVCPRALARLEDFADNLLLRRGIPASSSPEPPLDALQLCVHHGAGQRGETNMGRWIRRGLKLSPATLDVSGGDGYPTNLTFLSSSVSVSGGGAGRLTRVRLDNVLLYRDFEDLLGSGGLPVLEDLEIINAVIMSAICRIASDTLTSLAVVNVYCHHQIRCSVHIAASRLASLRLEFPLARLASVHFKIIDAPASLAQASIRLLEEINDDDDDDPDEGQISDLCLLLGSLSGVTSLHLSGFQETLVLQEVLDHVAFSWTTSKLLFPNLTSLVLEGCYLGEDVESLWSFLHMTPAITRLLLNRCKWPRSHNKQGGGDLEIPIALLSLKLVQHIGEDGKVHSVVKKEQGWTPPAIITKGKRK